MRWSAESHAGFSAVEPWLPLTDDWQDRNAAHRARPGSLLSLSTALLRLRRQHAVLRTGACRRIGVGEDIFAYEQGKGADRPRHRAQRPRRRDDLADVVPPLASPRRDHGYDVADYYSADPRYGALGDFVEFTHGCRTRGMRVMMGLVLNHTSDQHPWFQAALADQDSKFRGYYYIWSDEKPADAHGGMVFPGVQDSTWTNSRKAKAWQHHKFFEFQPDLNIANPQVQTELMKIAFLAGAGAVGLPHLPPAEWRPPAFVARLIAP